MCQTDDHCPKCGSRAQVEGVLSIILSLEDWPTASFFALLVIAMGKITQLSVWLTLSLAILAVLPILAFCRTKYFCSACQIQFFPPDGLAQNLEER